MECPEDAPGKEEVWLSSGVLDKKNQAHLAAGGKAPRLNLRGGQGEEPSQNHRQGPWVQ